jgi:hypothetical protein
MTADTKTRPPQDDENAKNPAWITPMNIKGVKPYQYDITTDTSGGSQHQEKAAPGSPPGSGPADPAGKNLQQVSDAARKLASQTGKSG